MARAAYDKATEESIVNAVHEARKSGSWKDAHEAAQKAGYKGGLNGLTQFISSRAKAASPAPEPVKAKRGPKPSKPKVAEEAPVQSLATTTPLDLDFPAFPMEAIPEAIRGDFAAMVRSKIEKEFDHAVEEKNLGLATALYLDIYEDQKALKAKIAELKAL